MGFLPRFTVLELMIAVAFVAVELGFGVMMYREYRRLHHDGPFPWVETLVNLAFLSLLIGGPAVILAWAIRVTRSGRRS